jgi:hypothetical protein
MFNICSCSTQLELDERTTAVANESLLVWPVVFGISSSQHAAIEALCSAQHGYSSSSSAQCELTERH